MMWLWTLAGTGAIATLWILWEYWSAPDVDEEHCPYRVEIDRIYCHGPCESHPPCRSI